MFNEAANFLIDVSNEPTANEIKNVILVLNRRFKDLIEGYHTFRQNEVIGKARAEYEVSIGPILDDRLMMIFVCDICRLLTSCRAHFLI